jgi:hypothetical protein
MDTHDQAENEKLAATIDPGINFFGMTNYRNQNRRFGIKIDDRRRHMYLVGKTGMGKTTILENMVLNDIYSGHGIGLVDPHGDFAEKVLNYIPPHRINDIVYFNPSDIDYPIGFNILEAINPEYKHLVTSGLMGVFKKIWPDVWARLASAGYANYRGSENIGQGCQTVECMVDAWMNSEGHRANILNPQWTYIGAAFDNPDGFYMSAVWTTDFGRGDGSVRPTPTPTRPPANGLPSGWEMHIIINYDRSTLDFVNRLFQEYCRGAYSGLGLSCRWQRATP